LAGGHCVFRGQKFLLTALRAGFSPG
jgi:hypothetical protein